MNSNNDRLLFLDGLKGLASVWVILFHFYVVVRPLLPENWIPVVSWPVVNVFFNGNYAVCLFLMISGFLASLSVDRKKAAGFPALQRMILKRYFRLAIPIGVIVLAVAAAYYSGLFSIHEYSLAFDNEMVRRYFHGLNYRHFIKQAVYSPLGYEQVLIPCWMLKYIFLGSFLVILLKIALSEVQASRRFVIYAVALVLLFEISLYYCCVLLGLILSDLWSNFRDYLDNKRFISVALLAVAVTVPSLAPSVIESDTLWNMIGSFCMLAAVLMSVLTKKFLSSKGMKFLGDISLGTYLIHWPVVCSLSCALLLAGHTSPLAVVCNLAGTLAVTLVLAFLYARYVEPMSGKIVDRLVDYLVRPSGKPSE